jgi:phage baseplate assembly protein W
MPYKNIEINNAAAVYQQPVKTSHFYKGFSSVDPTNFGTRLYDFDLIKQDIINQFNTRKGERVMNPRFGSIIWDLLMEPLTEEVRDVLNQDITEICNSDPRVVPIRLSLTEFESGYILEITLLLKGTDQSSTMKLSFDQKIGLSVQ